MGGRERKNVTLLYTKSYCWNPEGYRNYARCSEFRKHPDILGHVDKRLTDDTLGWNEQNVNQIGTQLKANLMDAKRR